MATVHTGVAWAACRHRLSQLRAPLSHLGHIAALLMRAPVHPLDCYVASWLVVDRHLVHTAEQKITE